MQLGVRFRTVLFVVVDKICLFLIKSSLSWVTLLRSQAVTKCKPHCDDISNNYTCRILSQGKEEEMCS